MAHKVFIDGQEGTTGLQIVDRLKGRTDIQLLEIDPQLRKDAAERRRLLNAADAAILCLPDDAAREAVAMVENPATRVYDASTAHRTADGWTYGLPELEPGAEKAVASSKRVSVPGCYATGFVLAVAPLVKAGLLAPGSLLCSHALSGYSGGGKKLIAKYEAPARAAHLEAPSEYALELKHKHVPEMQRRAGLQVAPIFAPIVAGYYKGMVVNVPLHAGMFAKPTTHESLREALAAHYAGRRFVKVMPYPASASLIEGFLDAQACNGTNRAEVFVFGAGDRMMVSVRLDNLGKGSSGACVQCLNLGLGLDEGAGLTA